MMFFVALIEVPLMLIAYVAVKIWNKTKQNAQQEKAVQKRALAVKTFRGKPAEYFESAQKMASMGENKLALASLRNSLEALVKHICSKYGINTNDPDTSLLQLIDQLYNAGAIDSQQRALMHKIRISANKGSHVELYESNVSEQEARETLKDMSDLIFSLKHRCPELYKVERETAISTPVYSPDYIKRWAIGIIVFVVLTTILGAIWANVH